MLREGLCDIIGQRPTATISADGYPPSSASAIRRGVTGFAPLGSSTPPARESLKPAVPIRRSVERDHVVCIECGFRARTLRRHLRIAHGLEPAAYRVRWKLSADHPLTAPAYSARRATMAREGSLDDL